jgi:uncharacterized OB-fold protein
MSSNLTPCPTCGAACQYVELAVTPNGKVCTVTYVPLAEKALRELVDCLDTEEATDGYDPA